MNKNQQVVIFVGVVLFALSIVIQPFQTRVISLDTGNQGSVASNVIGEHWEFHFLFAPPLPYREYDESSTTRTTTQTVVPSGGSWQSGFDRMYDLNTVTTNVRRKAVYSRMAMEVMVTEMIFIVFMTGGIATILRSRGKATDA